MKCETGAGKLLLIILMDLSVLVGQKYRLADATCLLILPEISVHQQIRTWSSGKIA
jgi:hypothetical protein